MKSFLTADVLAAVVGNLEQDDLVVIARRTSQDRATYDEAYVTAASIGLSKGHGEGSPEGTVTASPPQTYWQIVHDAGGVLIRLALWLKTSGVKTQTGWTEIQRFK